jgi:hypothetical protein
MDHMATKDPQSNPEPRPQRPPPVGAEIKPFPWEALKSKTAAGNKVADADSENDGGSNKVTLAVLGGFILLLVVAGVWLMGAIKEATRREECLMQGRRNCVPIVVPERER